MQLHTSRRNFPQFTLLSETLGMNRLTLILVLTLTVLLGSSGVCWGAYWEKGVDACKGRDYASALKEWTLLAEQGNADAQYLLGGVYFIGEGVPQDYKTAVKWTTRAAEQGDVRAQSNLGSMYHQGQGVPQDDKTAVKWTTLPHCEISFGV